MVWFQTGNTALMYAAFRGHDGVVKQLLERGADITIQNEDSMNVMDMVVGQGNKIGTLGRGDKL